MRAIGAFRDRISNACSFIYLLGFSGWAYWNVFLYKPLEV